MCKFDIPYGCFVRWENLPSRNDPNAITYLNNIKKKKIDCDDDDLSMFMKMVGYILLFNEKQKKIKIK